MLLLVSLFLQSKDSDYLQCNNGVRWSVSGAALVCVDHDVGQSVAPFPPCAQVSSVSLNLMEPLLGARFVRCAENERLPPNIKHLKSVVTFWICGHHAVSQTDGLPQHCELPTTLVFD